MSAPWNFRRWIFGQWVDLVHRVASRTLKVDTRRAIYIGESGATLRWEGPIVGHTICGAYYGIHFDPATKITRTVFMMRGEKDAPTQVFYAENPAGRFT